MYSGIIDSKCFFYNENGESIYDGNINKILTSIVSYASIIISKELDFISEDKFDILISSMWYQYIFQNYELKQTPILQIFRKEIK